MNGKVLRCILWVVKDDNATLTVFMQEVCNNCLSLSNKLCFVGADLQLQVNLSLTKFECRSTKTAVTHSQINSQECWEEPNIGMWKRGVSGMSRGRTLCSWLPYTRLNKLTLSAQISLWKEVPCCTWMWVLSMAISQSVRSWAHLTKTFSKSWWLIRNCGERNMKKVDNVLWLVDEQQQSSVQYADQLQQISPQGVKHLCCPM